MDAQHKLVRLASFGDTPLWFSTEGLPRGLASVPRGLTHETLVSLAVKINPSLTRRAFSLQENSFIFTEVEITLSGWTMNFAEDAVGNV